MEGSKKAFVLMPFKQPYDSYYSAIFKQTLEELSFEVSRADDLFEPCPIIESIQKRIVEADLVLCEMSQRNPNVFYELGLAHAIGKPVILISHEKEDIPFDLRHIRAIIYDYTIAGWEDKLRESIANAAKSVADTSRPWPPPLIGREKGSIVFKPIRPPNKNKLGILVDLSHRQKDWRSMHTIFDAAKASFVHDELGLSPQDILWDILGITDIGQVNAPTMAPWNGLLLGLPHSQEIGKVTRDEIIKWVRDGGHLAMMGFELGDRHHRTNLNKLAEEFGLRFNSDIIAPKGWRPPGKPYGEPVEFLDIGSEHPVLQSVKKLCLVNMCTLTTEPGANILLTAGVNGIAHITDGSVHYDTDGYMGSGVQNYEVIRNASWAPIIAEAPGDLTGSGKVLAIGTWELFGDFDEGFNNRLLVRNIMNWLVSQD